MEIYGTYMGTLWDHMGTLWDHMGTLWDYMGTLWSHMDLHGKKKVAVVFAAVENDDNDKPS